MSPLVVTRPDMVVKLTIINIIFYSILFDSDIYVANYIYICDIPSLAQNGLKYAQIVGKRDWHISTRIFYCLLSLSIVDFTAKSWKGVFVDYNTVIKPWIKQLMESIISRKFAAPVNNNGIQLIAFVTPFVNLVMREGEITYHPYIYKYVSHFP